MALSKLNLRTMKKKFKSLEKTMTKFGHGNGNWSKTKDLLYFSYALHTSIHRIVINPIFKAITDIT